MNQRGWACVARMGGVGDNLCAASTLRPLKRLGYKTEIITSEFAQVIFHNNPFLDKLSVKYDGDIPGGDAWISWFNSRGREYELFAHLSYSMEVRHALQVNSTAFWWRPEYRRKLCAGNYLETVHDIVGVPYEFGPLFFPTEEEKERAQETKQKGFGPHYIAWVISGSRIDKVHPYTAMAIARIIREFDIPVVMFGVGTKQFDDAKSVNDHVKRQNSTTDDGNIKEDHRLHLCLTPDGADSGGSYDWPIRRSLTQLLAADVVISPDTGMAWAAAFEPLPKIVMVSHASVENITKHWINTVTLHADPDRVPCWPCHRLHNDISTCTPMKDGGHGAACMADITVESILAEVKKALDKSRTATDGDVIPLRSHAR